jgi:chromatin segregation and condensation protein Rec8/ScpA/Scc1 (kleisin family)
MPETVGVAQILDAVEVAAARLPETKRLQFAGEALLQVAQLCETRAELLMSEWEEASCDPAVEQGFFDDLVRQTMAVDLSDLMEPTPARKPRTRRAKSNGAEEGSVAATVDKAAVLAMVEQLEAEAALEEERKQQVLAVAYDENVSQWTEAIAQRLQAALPDRLSFAQLCQSLGMPRVEVWLGVLLGEFELEGGEEFYSDALWVKAASGAP